MGSQENLIHKWLRQNIQPYTHRDTLFQHIATTLARYPTIRPKTDVYTFDDGRTQLLLCLHGLLPISFRGASYNIPIAVWLSREYPQQPPIAYVVPTNDMLVRPGPEMDVSGKCQLQYLLSWDRKPEGCSLVALLEAMQDNFSHIPPVYSKPARAITQPTMLSRPPVGPDYTSRPPPPVPGTHAPTPSQTSPSPIPAANNAPLPPLPAKPGNPAINPASRTASPALGMRPPPPIPPHSPMSSGVQTVSNSPVPPTYTLHAPARPIDVGGDPSPRPHAADSPAPTRTSSPPPVVAPAAPQPPPMPPYAPHVEPSDILDAQDLPDMQGVASPVSEAPAPPRPPNPELLRLHGQVHAKLRSELASLQQAMALDAERLRAHQADLLAGEPAIRDEMARLEAVRDVCRTVAERMRGVVDAGARNVAELKRKGDPEVDELVCSTTIVHNQLVNLVAEDNSIEDTIYHLHRALNSGRIDLEKFIRTTRALAEEQFMKRALIEKIQAGLPQDDLGLRWTTPMEWR
ncbi:UEV-domain-containing protein [Fomitopsis betulina]|nr:UEV-domain-containing protein [Fomitopsis betulina]